MPPLPHILADSDGLVQFIIFALFIGIWVVGALLSASKKKPGQQNKSWEEILAELKRQSQGPTANEPPPPLPPRQVQQRPMPPQVPQQRRPANRPSPPPVPPAPQMPRDVAAQRQARRKRQRQTPPPAPVFSGSDITPGALHADNVRPLAETPTPMAMPSIADVPDPSPAGRPAIAKLLTPGTLRQQFILTEILQPPIAMRDQPGR